MARQIGEAFIRHAGELGQDGLLMPRLVTIGDLDLDEALGSLLDPLDAEAIPPAVDPTRRWLAIADILREELGDKAPSSVGLLRLAREMARTMDRVLAEDIAPDQLVGEPILDMLGSLSEHWIKSLHLFLGVQDRWIKNLEQREEVDVATRRNLLFAHAARQWRAAPPAGPVVAAGITSAAPALARLLRTIADLPDGSVILPDLDLSLSDEAWEELGRAGHSPEPGGEVFGNRDALTHPQYHLKLLLNRMGIAREEVRPWHRRGLTAANPDRSHAISSLFLPPKASQSWVDLPAAKRRLSGVRLIATDTVEEEAQTVALLVRQAIEQPSKRVAVITPDRSLAARIVQHLSRWNIVADDTAGRPLAITPAGRLLLLLAELVSDRIAPVALIATLSHPLVKQGEERAAWLAAVRTFERALRGPAPASGFGPLREAASRAGLKDWWGDVEPVLQSLTIDDAEIAIASAIDILAEAAETLADQAIWAREDGRALSSLVEDLRLQARQLDSRIEVKDLAGALREMMQEIAVRPPYGGHPRVAVYGLLEARGARADLIICCGLNEDSWPQNTKPDALLAPGILRRLGVPGAEFRVGLAAHDLASALGAPEVVLSRARRGTEGPTIPSRFLLRVEALLGELAAGHEEQAIPSLVPLLDRAGESAEPYPQPRPNPSSDLRNVPIKVTALDRLLGDPYQFYASEILQLRSLEALAADPFTDPRLRGTLAHDILEAWHKARAADPGVSIIELADQHLRESNAHPLLWGLWRPRLLAALERFAGWVAEAEREERHVLAVECEGSMEVDGVRIYGRADRIDQLADSGLVVVDYKTGQPPSAKQVEAGFALQLGTLALIARDGAFKTATGELKGLATRFEYWSMARSRQGDFGYIDQPLKVGRKISGLAPEDFLPHHEAMLNEAISRFIKGADPFTAKENPAYPGYTEYDQLMRLEEWAIRMGEGDPQ